VASRDDVTVELTTSPRVAEVSAPSQEITMQDLVDTLRDIEASFQGTSYEKLLNASGKEDLGGGVQVGITVALQNLLLAFQARTTPAEEGTVSTNPGSAISGLDTFTDASATFVTNDVKRGSLVINFDDRSIADVVSVDSETQLTTKVLVNGVSNTYGIGDNYQVFNIIKVKADGGNLTAVDELQASIDPILPTAFTQVILTSSSSATSTSQDALERGLYGGAVCFKPSSPYDINSTVDGRVGTRQFPLNNIQDCYTIALDLGLNVIEFLENCTVAGVDVSASPILFKGLSPQFVINFDPSANVTGCEVEFATVRGELDGLNIIRDCLLLDTSAASGFFEKCAFIGPVTLGGATNMYECYSAVTGTNSPQFFLGNFDLQVRDFHGSFGVCGKTGGDSSIEIYGGKLEVDATSTGGNIYLRGAYSVPPVIDPASGTTVFDQTNTSKDLRLVKALEGNRVDISADGLTIEVYDDDNVTLLRTLQLSADKRFRTVV